MTFWSVISECPRLYKRLFIARFREIVTVKGDIDFPDGDRIPFNLFDPLSRFAK